MTNERTEGSRDFLLGRHSRAVMSHRDKTVGGHRMHSRGLAVGIVLSTAFLFGAGQDKTDGSPDSKGKATLQKVCTGCHELDVVTTNRFTKTVWQQTVDDMISRGANASDDEVTELVAYLTKNYGQLNINTATQPQLQDTLGLTEKEAQAIITYREKNGAIKNFDELKSVPGVSAEKLQAKRNMIAYTSL
jgi:competence protein ComEA